MDAEPEFVTVFRSADETAKDDASAILDLLARNELEAKLFDDNTPGVPAGAWEVRVPSADVERAEKLIAGRPGAGDELANVDNSADLNLETVFRQPAGGTYEIEALAVKSMLEANGIYAVLVGDPVLPNFSMEVRVAKEHVEEAMQLISEAEASGPAAAEEAERATESTSE